MIGTLPSTIIPWLLGGLFLLALLTLINTLKSWREAKRSPYFFLRRQAAKRMQTYLVASLVLILVTIASTGYAWRAPEDTTVRVAVLKHAKLRPELRDMEADSEVVTESSPMAVDISLSPGADGVAESAGDLADPLLPRAILPDTYNQLEPTVELADSTNLGDVSFSADITEEYQAIDPGRRFTAGYFTLYATFDYDDMADGMVWSWVWRRNGKVIDGGNQVWSYGDSGPGYVYLRPEEGFQLGDHDLEIWVNQELFAQSNFTIIDGVSASN